MGLTGQSIVYCFPELCCLVFRGSAACGVAKAIYKQFCFSHLSLAAGFNNKIVYGIWSEHFTISRALIKIFVIFNKV